MVDAYRAIRFYALAALAMAVAPMGSGCSKRYTEIEVRDPGRVDVAGVPAP